MNEYRTSRSCIFYQRPDERSKFNFEDCNEFVDILSIYEVKMNGV